MWAIDLVVRDDPEECRFLEVKIFAFRRTFLYFFPCPRSPLPECNNEWEVCTTNTSFARVCTLVRGSAGNCRVINSRHLLQQVTGERDSPEVRSNSWAGRRHTTHTALIVCEPLDQPRLHSIVNFAEFISGLLTVMRRKQRTKVLRK